MLSFLLRILCMRRMLLALILSMAHLSAMAATTLADFFNLAWNRQIDVAVLPARLEATSAKTELAKQWFAGAPNLALAYRSDQLQRNQGGREWDVGVAIPLWLPGESDLLRGLAEQELSLLKKNLYAKQFLFAGQIRSLWWQWQLSRIDVNEAQRRWQHSQHLTDDVARRVQAGLLARTDLLQAQSAQAQALGILTNAESQALQALTSLRERLPDFQPEIWDGEGEPITVLSESEPMQSITSPLLLEQHPLLSALAAEFGLAQGRRNLALVQRYANPEIRISTRADRSMFGETYIQSSAVSVRVPLGSDGRARVRVAEASAEQIQAEVSYLRLAEQLPIWQAAQAQRWRNAAQHVQSAQARARLAEETRRLLDKSFRLGQTDLPTRLRVELEAFDAARQALRAQVEQAALLSEWRQSLGLLPEMSLPQNATQIIQQSVTKAASQPKSAHTNTKE